MSLRQWWAQRRWPKMNGDGKHDDTAAFQELINAQAEGRPARVRYRSLTWLELHRIHQGLDRAESQGEDEE